MIASCYPTLSHYSRMSDYLELKFNVEWEWDIESKRAELLMFDFLIRIRRPFNPEYFYMWLHPHLWQPTFRKVNPSHCAQTSNDLFFASPSWMTSHSGCDLDGMMIDALFFLNWISRNGMLRKGDENWVLKQRWSQKYTICDVKFAQLENWIHSFIIHIQVKANHSLLWHPPPHVFAAIHNLFYVYN